MAWIAGQASSSGCLPWGRWGMAVPCACPVLQEEHSALSLPAWPMPAVHPLQDTLHKRSPDFGTTVFQDKVHLGKCKPSPVTASPGNRAVCPVVPSRPLTALAGLQLCHGAAIPGAP